MDDIISINKRTSFISTYSFNSLKKKINDLKDIGFSNKNIIKIIKSTPSILTLSIENIISKIKLFSSLGFTKEEILNIILKFPAVITMSPNNIVNKVNNIVSLGFIMEEVIYMIKKYPPLISLSIENINSKVQFYDSIGLHDIIVKRPLYLMMSVRLAYARYIFFKRNGIYFSKECVGKLFLSDKQFKQMYSISNETLINTYDYDKRSNKEMKLIEE